MSEGRYAELSEDDNFWMVFACLPKESKRDAELLVMFVRALQDIDCKLDGVDVLKKVNQFWLANLSRDWSPNVHNLPKTQEDKSL